MDDYLSKPIRPGDISSMLVKWSAPQNVPDAAAPTPAAAKPDTAEPAVDMDRLTELAGGDKEMLRELIELFNKQTSRQLAQLQAAVPAGNTEEVRHLAHSCKGASATMGMAPLAAVFFELEKLGRAANLDGAAPLLVNAQREFKRVQDFLAAPSAVYS